LSNNLVHELYQLQIVGKNFSFLEVILKKSEFDKFYFFLKLTTINVDLGEKTTEKYY